MFCYCGEEINHTNVPYLLACGDSLCGTCIDAISSDGNKVEICCPICAWRYTYSNINFLPVNHHFLLTAKIVKDVMLKYSRHIGKIPFF